VLTHRKAYEAYESLSALSCEQFLESHGSWTSFKEALESFAAQLEKILPALALETPPQSTDSSVPGIAAPGTSVAATGAAEELQVNAPAPAQSLKRSAATASL
jgi:hypothetical protein